MSVLKIMIADDHRILREGLRLLFQNANDFEVVAEAGDGIECISKISAFRPDYLILDLNMPKLDGILAFQKIKEKNPKQRVIVLTENKDIDTLYKLYNMGINGYVLKESAFSSLLKAIAVIENGDRYIEPILIPALKDKLESIDNDDNETSILTKRELQILKLVSQGLYNKEIAAKLGVTEKTVKNHITSLFKKIDVSDRTQAAVYAIKNGYVNMD